MTDLLKEYPMLNILPAGTSCNLERGVPFRTESPSLGQYAPRIDWAT
jgi:hypothetical protein